MRKTQLNYVFLLLAALAAIFSLPAQAAGWTATGSMPAARYYHTATLFPNGAVLVAGGLDNNHISLASAALYDPTIGTWIATGSLATARYAHTATLLPNGKVLVAGGYNNQSTIISLASAAVYEPVTRTWAATGTMSTARAGHTATLLPNGKVLVAGGFNTSGNTALASAAVYDPATGTWTATGSMPAARSGHTATLLPNGKVLIAGGSNNSGTALASAAVYDPATGTWAATSSMPAARYYHTATLLPNGKVLVAGGAYYYNNNFFVLASAAVYDPATGTWAATSALPEARRGHTATLLSDGKVLVAGGLGGCGVAACNNLASAEVYNPATGTWTATSTMTTASDSHTATLLPNGKVLVAGGEKLVNGTFIALASAELYTPDALPDFVVTGITLTPASPGINTAFTANVTVKNQGKSAGDGGKLLVWANQGATQLCGAAGDQAVAVGTLAAGASATLTVSGLTAGTAGTKLLRAFVDGACATLESNEGNNQRTASYRVHGSLPDFVVSAATLNPASPKPNTYFTATVTVTNQGTAAAIAGYLDVWADQANAQPCGAEGDGWAAVGSLAAGASKPVAVRLLAGTAGAKTLRAFVDSWCGTSESNEDNNQSTTGYTVK